MTAAPDSPPLYTPWTYESIGNQGFGIMRDARGDVLFPGDLYREDRAKAIIRAVNNHAKMREALEKISNHKQQAIPSALDGMAAQYSRIIRDFKSIARTILKEIDNGHE